MLEQLRLAGLMVTFNPPVFSKNNVKLDRDIYPVSGNYEIAVSSSTGQIYYTLDGTDPRMIGDQINSSAKEIVSGGTLGLKGTALLNARVKSGDRWSAFYVIASKPKWFYERHFLAPSGNFNKNFANSGEQVTVSTAAGNPIISFTYSDAAPWPIEANGDGVSLSTLIRNPTGNPADPAYWSFSSVYDGTPFADDPGIIDFADDLPVSGNSVSVYPNPAKGLLYLKVDKENSGVQVKIYSLSGSMIFQSAIVGNSIIDLGRLNIQAGIYLVNTKCNDKNAVHKVIYQP